MAVAVGTLIDGRYEVLGFLGKGGYGEVYRVRDHYLNTIVALKLVVGVPVRNVWAEAQALMRLRSDYILEVRNADLVAGTPYLVTELAAHGSADAAMAPVGVHPELAVRWIRHACRGAARTHADRLLHRDIKPHNVFLTATGNAQLGDFGIAVLMDPNGEGPALGTPVTKAPEVVTGGNTSVQSDVFSLGASLYALLAGVFPLQVGNAALRDVAPHIPRALAERVGKAMATNPRDRYQSASEFDSALGDLPAVERRWVRTDEHLGHTRCYRGSAKGKADATVCLVPAGTRWAVEARHASSGNRITKACRKPAPQSAIARNLRAAMSNVP
jgi:serine/threonine-protein kinase